MSDRLRHIIPPAISSLIFILPGLILIPYPGLQQDELLFAVPIYARGSALGSWRIASHSVPIMIMTYIGAVKTALYELIFRVWAPSVWSVRVPALFAGAVFIWLVWIWVTRIAGRFAASVATILLATDVAFLITNTFDWGPVALQHLFLIGGLLAIDQARRGQSRKWFALAGFLWGLGLWDKALFIWILAAMGVAAVCLWPRECLLRIRNGSALIGVAALLAGCLPLLIFNVRTGGSTVRENSHFSGVGIGLKLTELRATVEGSGMFGFFAVEKTRYPGKPHSMPERVSVAISAATGHREENFAILLLLSAVALAIAFVRQERRSLLFCVITTSVAWLEMALMPAGGGGAHHIVLLWPFPFVFVGIALSAFARRFGRMGRMAAVLIVAIAVAGNLRTTNEYLADLITNGPGVDWTDAIDALSRAFPLQYRGPITAVDWGYSNALIILHGGLLRIRTEVVPTAQGVLIQHVKDSEILPGSNEKAAEAGRLAGMKEQVDRVIDDSHGRPVFEVFHFVPLRPSL